MNTRSGVVGILVAIRAPRKPPARLSGAATATTAQCTGPNSPKTATVTVVIFGLFGPVAWGVVAVAAPASLVGGFLGARVATRIPTTPLRIFIVVFGVAVSIYLFARI